MQQDRIVLEKFADYWNAANVHIERVVFRPIVESTVRLANLRSGSLDLIERALATDLKEIKADPKLKLATQIEIGYQGLTLNLGNGDAGKNGPFGKDPRVRQALEAAIDRKALSDVVVQRRGVCRATSGSARRVPIFSRNSPVPGARRGKGQEAARRGRRDDAGRASTSWCRTTRRAARRRRSSRRWHAEAGFDLKIRVTEFATSLNGGRSRALPGLLHRLELAASIPMAISYIFLKVQGAAEQRPLLQQGCRPVAR